MNKDIVLLNVYWWHGYTWVSI